MKYKLSDEKKEVNGTTLYRIESLKDFGDIKRGDKGGWISCVDNLSQQGNSWVSGKARVSGKAQVSEDAKVSGKAWVSGKARVSGKAQVRGKAWVSEDAWVFGEARVYGEARVSGKAWVFGGAWVFGEAWVHGEAKVFGKAKVLGQAWVYGEGRVSGKARVSPINITGLKYNVTIIDTHIQIGCEYHSTKDWMKYNESDFKIMDGEAALAFSKYREVILALAKLHQEKI